MQALTYAWRVAVNVAYVAVVLLVFSSVRDRELVIILGAIGLVYVAIKGAAIGQFLAYGPLFVGMARSLDKINETLGLTEVDITEAYQEAEAKLKVERTKGYIEIGFLALISVICIFQIFTSL